MVNPIAGGLSNYSFIVSTPTIDDVASAAAAATAAAIALGGGGGGGGNEDDDGGGGRDLPGRAESPPAPPPPQEIFCRIKRAPAGGFTLPFQKLIGGGAVRERACVEVAASAGLAPGVLHWGGDGDRAVVALRKVDGDTLTKQDLRDERTLKRVVEALAALHSLRVPHARLPPCSVSSGYRLRPVVDFHVAFARGLPAVARRLPRTLDGVVAALHDLDAIMAASGCYSPGCLHVAISHMPQHFVLVSPYLRLRCYVLRSLDC